MSDKRYFPIFERDKEVVPFENTQDAWFWFIQAQKARSEGARIAAGQALYPRPCEPIDIFKVIDRLYRQRRLDMNHFNVLRHYGVRGFAPDPRRVKEARAHKLWKEAMERIEPILVRKNIVEPPRNIFAHDDWAQASLYEMVAAE